MRLLTKVMTGLSAIALSVIIAGGVNAEAAVSFTAQKEMKGIDSGDMVSYDAVKDKKGTLTWNAKAKWDTYYGMDSNSFVDITNVKTTKDAYITVKTTSGAYNVYKIEKDSITKWKGKIEGTTLSIEQGTDKLTSSSDDWGKYAYRTEKGGWTLLKNGKGINLAPFEQQGATLYFRYVGNTDAFSGTKDDKAAVDGAPTGITVYKIAADSFAGKDFKVKVPKMANAPAIAIDYNTGAVKPKKNTEYRALSSAPMTADGDWKDFDANYTINTAAAGIFQMRTKATDKKAVSKIAVYSWERMNAPAVEQPPEKAAASGKIIDGKLEYTSAETEDIKKATYVITNKTSGDTGETYALYKAKEESGKKVVADSKAVAFLKPGKSVTFKNAKLPDKTELLIQVVGDKKTDRLPSPFASNTAKILYNVKAASATK